MKVLVETADNAVETMEMKVVSSWSGNVAIAIEEKIFSFLPGHAVEIWRVLQGDKESKEVPYVRHGLVYSKGIARIFYEGTDGCKLNLCLSHGLRVVMDANEAYALAWALRRCVEDALFEHRADGAQFEFTETKTLTSVWVLTSRRLDAVESDKNPFSECLGGWEEIFLSRASADDRVRDFIRHLVKESYSEAYWENHKGSVDDIVKHVLENSEDIDGVTFWRHDGNNESFEVKLAEREVNP